MKTTVLLPLSLAIAIIVAAPSAHARKKVDDAAIQTQQTQQYVDAKMHETLSSIDRQLTTLVKVSRGGEADRKEGPIGPTVAGAAGPNRPATRPDSLPIDPSVLDKKVQIQWNGSAEALLRNLSEQIGFRYVNRGGASDKRVRIESKDLPVREVLNLVAAQIDGQADIHVSLSDRSLGLARR